MPETITIYAESIEDISPMNKDSIEVTLSGVDLGQLIQELGFEAILEELKKEDVDQFYKDKAELEEQENV